MSVVFIEANATGTTSQAMSQAREMGYEIIFMTGQFDFYNTVVDDPRRLADRVIEVNTYDPFAVAHELDQTPVAAVVSFDDYHLPVTAIVAELLGLPGASLLGLLATRFKDRGRGLTRDLPGGAVPYRVVSSTDPEQLSSINRFPVVVKPVDDSGSVDVRLCHTTSEVADAIRTGLQRGENVRGYRRVRRMIVEDFIDGPEFSCELSWDGENCSWRQRAVTTKLVGPPPYFVELGHVVTRRGQGGHGLDDLVSARVQGWLAALSLTAGAAHVEFRLGPGGPTLIEVNPRLPGGHITKLVESVTGVNMVTDYLDFHLGRGLRPVSPSLGVEAAAVRFLTRADWRPDTIKLLAEIDLITCRERILPTLPDARASGPPTSNYDRVGHVLLSGSDEDVSRDLRSLDNLLTTTR